LNPDRNKFKASLLSNVTSKYSETKYNNDSQYTNEEWFNNILCVEPRINNDVISLDYITNYVYKSSDLIIQSPMIFNSGYSQNLKNILSLLQDKNNNHNKPPFHLIKDLSIFNNIEVYGIFMGFQEIDKILNFVKNFTLEPPMSFYCKETMHTTDYIFYNGDMTPVRTLNIPNINKIAFEIGYLPNEHFPSDHISFCVDFLLNNIK
jgi:hypothetical protein